MSARLAANSSAPAMTSGGSPKAFTSLPISPPCTSAPTTPTKAKIQPVSCASKPKR
jgi:hypothetical protein